MFWNVPKAWSGEIAFIIGGGPSIRDFDFNRLRGRGRVIAVNDAGIVPGRATWADVLYWADRRWLDWNADKLVNHTGTYKISRRVPHVPLPPGVEVQRLDFMPKRFSEFQCAVGGWCGGSNAINLAYLFGVQTIVLLGFDMKEAPVMNWHTNHKAQHEPGQHERKFIPAIETMAHELRRLRVSVINTNHESGLRCFPFMTIDDVLHSLAPYRG